MSHRFTFRHAAEVVLRLFVWGVLTALCSLIWLAILLAIGMLIKAEARADSIAIKQWDVELSDPAPMAIDVYRGETIFLQPRLLQYQAAVNIADVYEVVLRYRDTTLPDGYYYAVTGSVLTAAEGRLQIVWTPACEAAASAYTYSIAAKTVAGDTLRGFGAIRLRGTVQGSVTNQPDVTTTFDWAAVEHINPASAPFLTDAELIILQNQVSALGTSKVDVVDWNNTNSVLSGRIGTVETGKVDKITFDNTNAAHQAAIADAATKANLAGDVTGPSTTTIVVRIRGVPVSALSPGVGEDGYGLKYDHATGGFILGPVASEGTSISNLLLLADYATATDVPFGSVGMYQILRPGNLPSAVLNVGGYEVGYFDLMGLTLRAGSLHLLSDDLEVNPAAYDGSVEAPAYTWAQDRNLGKYRFSYLGGSAEGFTINSNLVWWWGPDGIHIEAGMSLFGLPYADQIASVSGRVSVVETGKVGVAAWSGSNLVLQAGIDSKAGTGTVASIDQRVSVLETGKVEVAAWSGSNLVLQAGIDSKAGTGTVASIDERLATVEGFTAPGGVLTATGGVRTVHVSGTGSPATLGSATVLDPADMYKLAISHEGRVIAAVTDGATIRISTDYGSSWADRDASGIGSNLGVSASSNGAILYASDAVTSVWKSVDSGTNWARTGPIYLGGSGVPYDTVCSHDGSKVVVADGGGEGLCAASTNGGSTWLSVSDSGLGVLNQEFWNVGIAGDGSIAILAASEADSLYVWKLTGTLSVTNRGPDKTWRSPVASDDGRYMGAIARGEGIYRSTDSGTNWALVHAYAYTDGGAEYGGGLAMTPDGRVWIAKDAVSLNYGVDWTSYSGESTYSSHRVLTHAGTSMLSGFDDIRRRTIVQPTFAPVPHYLWGNADTDGSWRTYYDTILGTAVIQVRSMGVWTNAEAFTRP